MNVWSAVHALPRISFCFLYIWMRPYLWCIYVNMRWLGINAECSLKKWSSRGHVQNSGAWNTAQRETLRQWTARTWHETYPLKSAIPHAVPLGADERFSKRWGRMGALGWVELPSIPMFSNKPCRNLISLVPCLWKQMPTIPFHKSVVSLLIYLRESPHV